MSVLSEPTSEQSDLSLPSLGEHQSTGMPLEELLKFRESEEGKKLVGWIKEKFVKCKNLRAKEERQWNINLAMYNGNQWIQMYQDGSPLAGRLTQLGRSRNRETQTINRIKPIIRTEIAKFTSQKPGATVIPATDEDEDLLAAEAAEQAWISTSERRHLDNEQADAVFWMCITGNGFIKTTWDGEIYDDHSGLEGDVRYESVDPYKIFVPDLKEKDIQDQPFIFHSYVKNLEWLQLHFEAELAGKKLSPTSKEADSIMEEAFARPRTDDDTAFDSCTLYEFWVKPGNCPMLPKGGMVTMIDDTLVEVHQSFPYEHGEYPIAHMGHIKREGFYQGSIIEDLINLQMDYNKLRSQIAESRKKMGKPQMAAQKGSISVAKMTNEIGLVVEYGLGMQPPTPLPLQQLPQYIMQEVEFILRDFEDLSGQHEVSKGQTPPGVTAATAIAYLQEADDSYILPSFKSVERATEVIARHTLLLMAEYWDVPRMVKVIGKDDAFSTMLLDRSDLKRGTDIRVEEGSALPQSKAARQAFIMDLMTNGFIDPNEGLDMLHVGGTQKLIDRIKSDKRQAQRENIKFKRLTPQDFQMFQQEMAQQMQGVDPESMIDPETGEPFTPPVIIPVNDWDNHDIHIEEHNRFRKTQEFEILPAEIKAEMQKHVEMHEAMKLQKMWEDSMMGMGEGGMGMGHGGEEGGEESMGMPTGEVEFEQSGGPMEAAEPNAAPGAEGLM